MSKRSSVAPIVIGRREMDRGDIMKRTRRLLSVVVSVAAIGAAGCDLWSPYAEPPARTYSVDQFTLVPKLGDTVTVTGATVTPEFFTASSVRPWLGRFFTANEYESVTHPVVVISHDLWRQRFGALPQLIGERVQLNGEAVTLIGVAPPDFVFPTDAAVWVPNVPR